MAQWKFSGGTGYNARVGLSPQARNFLPGRKVFLSFPCFNDRTDRRKQKPNC